MQNHHPRPALALVLVTYNHRDDVSGCLESIYAQTRTPADVIVVDNASQDGTSEFVGSRYPRVVVIRNDRNVGYGAANNQGIARTRTPLVAAVNPDVRLDPEWTEEMLLVMGEHPECAAMEGKLLLAEPPGLLNSGGSRLNFLGFGCTTGYGKEDGAGVRAERVSYPSGAAFVVRKEAFLQIGGFDESYFLYHEDVDLGLRLQVSGWSILYVPRARATHAFRSGLNEEKIQYLEQNRWKTLAKNMPFSYFLRSAPLLLALEGGLLIYLALTGLLRPKLRAIWAFMRELPRILAQRRSHHQSSVDPAVIMTDDFPALLPRYDWAAFYAQRLQSSYDRAFMAPAASSSRGDDPFGG